ncbi:MAG: hypothetical protein MZV64_13585 [Ignavibacteriales bacterium]|nr:hypothetical protein [Ignavibacteriales bacterium]
MQRVTEDENVSARTIVRNLVRGGLRPGPGLAGVRPGAPRASCRSRTRRSRRAYQLAIMADVLERAVQQGARLMSRQLQGGMPQMMLIGGDARARDSASRVSASSSTSTCPPCARASSGRGACSTSPAAARRAPSRS